MTITLMMIDDDDDGDDDDDDDGRDDDEYWREPKTIKFNKFASISTC